MTDHASLLPPNSTPVERAIEASTARIQDVPTPVADLWSPNACPSAFLPWLAWGVSVDTWDSDWDDATKRAVIVASPGVHMRKGTAGAVKDAVAAIGASITVTPWFEQTPPGAPYTFTVELDVSDPTQTTAAFAQQVSDAVNASKAERDHFTLSAPIFGLASAGVSAFARPVNYLRLELAQ